MEISHSDSLETCIHGKLGAFDNNAKYSQIGINTNSHKLTFASGILDNLPASLISVDHPDQNLFARISTQFATPPEVTNAGLRETGVIGNIYSDSTQHAKIAIDETDQGHPRLWGIVNDKNIGHISQFQSVIHSPDINHPSHIILHNDGPSPIIIENRGTTTNFLSHQVRQDGNHLASSLSQYSQNLFHDKNLSLGYAPDSIFWGQVQHLTTGPHSFNDINNHYRKFYNKNNPEIPNSKTTIVQVEYPDKQWEITVISNRNLLGANVTERQFWSGRRPYLHEIYVYPHLLQGYFRDKLHNPHLEKDDVVITQTIDPISIRFNSEVAIIENKRSHNWLKIVPQPDGNLALNNKNVITYGKNPNFTPRTTDITTQITPDSVEITESLFRREIKKTSITK